VAQVILPELLDLQDGVLSRSQALACGLTTSGIAARLRAGRWRRVHRGVYATHAGPLSHAARAWAALLYCGAGAALSHGTAAVLHGLSGPHDGPIHVTVPAHRKVVPQPGIVIHRSRRLTEKCEAGVVPARVDAAGTVLDLVDGARSEKDAFVVASQACQRQVTTASQLAVALDRRPETRWASGLKAVLDDVASGAHSLLELRYLRDVERRHGLPRANRQRPLGRDGRREWTDCAYEEFATIVELDGRLGHDGPGAWRDMDRDNRNLVAGEATLRYGWADVVGRPCEVARQVATVLRIRGWRDHPCRCGDFCTL
jgi:Transcriptional regulator, AbiEi antitoxin